MRFGGLAATRAQLQHILDMSERENMMVEVIPIAAGGFPGFGQTIFYAAGPVPQLDTVQLDQSHGSVLLAAAAQLAKYRLIMERLQSIALTPVQSRDFIRNIERDL